MNEEELLATLSPGEREEALAAAAAARRAEERAEQRALERAMEQKRAAREQEQDHQQLRRPPTASIAPQQTTATYIPKHKRMQQQQQQQKNAEDQGTETRGRMPITAAAADSRQRKGSPNPAESVLPRESSNLLSEAERIAVKTTYLGKSWAKPEEESQVPRADKKRKQANGSKRFSNFRFQWDETDDTFNNEDPLYAPIRAAYRNDGEQASKNNKKRQRLEKLIGTAEDLNFNTVSTKALATMTPRDWNIFRENYEITVKGGKSPPPMRSFRESPAPELPALHPSLLHAIESVMRFTSPSPIQRQAIPIGLQRRDLIGIAETGSGKTVAFGLPLCNYLLQLPSAVLQSVADQGPLALIMAPTRELAQQINIEIQRLLSRQKIIRSISVTGGPPIQQQAQQIRSGVHIIVGTPGRINDCIEMTYLVLNQCSYIVMDEADRMVDMGFLPQMEAILEAMGGTMKSEDESETYRQEQQDLKEAGVARHRLTAMFSATMPPEVEQIAKRFLRHPAVVTIGDKDSGKNARIQQKLIWLSSPSKKENELRRLMQDSQFLREKIIVFVNERKYADGVGRTVERAGRKCVVLHGGKSQAQREESLEVFRRGGVVMVATDVAGRGLDIPDVAHVINYDLPTQKIEPYTHRIGRTGRAGKKGYATSFITDEDEGIMAQLRAYLKSTGNPVPQRLARHRAAQSVADGGHIVH